MVVRRVVAVRLVGLTNVVLGVDGIVREVAGEVTDAGRYVEVCGDGGC